jgi:carbon monoxide dehydrogenase subunit G
VRWRESIIVERPVAEVWEAVVDQRELLQWSAWPEATGFRCSLEGDGTSIGSEIVFRSRDGVEQGRQRLALVDAQRRRVRYDHDNRGPRGRRMHPVVELRLEPAGPGRTRVLWDFEASVPLPLPVRPLAEAVLGRRVRALHVKDLEQLKAHLERRPAPAAAA